jgi:hypothetical protein
VSFIDTIHPHAAEGETAAMYRRQQAAWGYVPNYAKAFSHRPEVMARWGALLAEIKRPMDRRRFELATFAAAHELRNSACALAHGRALGEFFAEAEVVAIAEGRLDGVSTMPSRTIVRFARRVARGRVAHRGVGRRRARDAGARRGRDLRHRRGRGRPRLLHQDARRARREDGLALSGRERPLAPRAHGRQADRRAAARDDARARAGVSPRRRNRHAA